MSIRRLGDVQLYGPTSQATTSFAAGVMLDAADYATWQQEANAANQASYTATLATYAAMSAAGQSAAPPAAPPANPPATVPASSSPAVCPAWGCDGPPVLIPVPITPPAPAAPATIPDWVYWAAGAAALLILAKAL